MNTLETFYPSLTTLHFLDSVPLVAGVPGFTMSGLDQSTTNMLNERFNLYGYNSISSPIYINDSKTVRAAFNGTEFVFQLIDGEVDILIGAGSTPLEVASEGGWTFGSGYSGVPASAPTNEIFPNVGPDRPLQLVKVLNWNSNTNVLFISAGDTWIPIFSGNYDELTHKPKIMTLFTPDSIEVMNRIFNGAQLTGNAMMDYTGADALPLPSITITYDNSVVTLVANGTSSLNEVPIYTYFEADPTYDYSLNYDEMSAAWVLNVSDGTTQTTHYHKDSVYSPVGKLDYTTWYHNTTQASIQINSVNDVFLGQLARVGGNIYQYTPAGWLLYASSPIRAYTASQFGATSNTTLSTTGAAVSLKPNTTYKIRALLLIDASAGGAKSQLTFTASSSNGGVHTAGKYVVNSTATPFTLSSTSTGSGIATSASAGSTIIEYEFIVRTDANFNTVELRFAQNTSNATPSYLQSNSYIEVTTIQ